MQTFVDAVTSFIFVEDTPAPADVILLPGSRHANHTRYAATLYRAGLAPWVLPSGLHAISLDAFPDPAYPSEWAFMRAALMADGVPDSAILREDRATYTWQNACFSRDALAAAGITARTAILCCKPFHARRALFYYQTALPDTRILVCPALDEQLNRHNWYLSAEGRQRVLGEVAKMGTQISEIFESTWEEQAHDHA